MPEEHEVHVSVLSERIKNNVEDIKLLTDKVERNQDNYRELDRLLSDRIAVLERDRARLFGFVLGAAAVGGGIGTVIGSLLGG